LKYREDKQTILISIFVGVTMVSRV